MRHSRYKQTEKAGGPKRDRRDPDDKNIPMRANVSHLYDYLLDMSMEINHKYDRFRKGYQHSW